ncbi:MAG: RNA 3'-terminal phosphate cyclase [Candidatus Hodarchaeales archaeon]
MESFDGSLGEGGGAILRLVTSLALIKQEPVRIFNIRKNRPKPGLQTQHLMGIKALAEFCGGELEGDFIGSDSLIFEPDNNWKSQLKIKISTAGSIGLILQVFQLAVIVASNFELKIDFQGGATFGKWAPSVPYIDKVTWKLFRRLGLDYSVEIERHGFYPKGGALVSSVLGARSNFTGIRLREFKYPEKVVIESYASRHLQRNNVAERQAKAVSSLLDQHDIEIETRTSYVEALNPGSGVLIYSDINDSMNGADFVGEKRLSAESVGREAYKRYFKSIETESTVDPLLADQIIPILSVASGSSEFSTPYISKHTETNIKIIQKMLDIKIEVIEEQTHQKISIDV